VSGEPTDADADAGDGTEVEGTGAVYRVEVRVVAPVRPTEVTDRVADAVRNLFPDAEVVHEEGRVVGTTRSVERFAALLRRQEILDTARKRLLEGVRGDAVHVELKKLAAFQGVVNFSVGSPDEVGDLEVRVRVEEPSVEAFVDAVAPPTEDGEPVTE
jgi:predicted RNA binding protein with dsRBD fold (UPF0201 family)